MATEPIEQETEQNVMVAFSLNGMTSPPVSLRAFLEDVHVFITGNTLTLSPNPSWCEDGDPANAGEDGYYLAAAVEATDVDRSVEKMLESSLVDIEEHPDEVAILRDILIKTAAALVDKLNIED